MSDVKDPEPATSCYWKAPLEDLVLEQLAFNVLLQLGESTQQTAIRRAKFRPVSKAAYKAASKAGELEWLLPVLDPLPDEELLVLIATMMQEVDRRAVHSAVGTGRHDLSLYGAGGAVHSQDGV